MKPPLVLLHGWGARSRVWDALAQGFGADQQVIAPDWSGYGRTMEHAVEQLAATAPAHCSIAGWSLGGQLALAWARLYPQQVTSLMLIASTPRFVSAPGWPHGMAPEVFDGFSASLARDAGSTLRRFLLLQARGDAQARAVTRQLEAAQSLQALPAGSVLMETLRWLQFTDLRASLAEIPQRTLVMHGDCDRIAAPAAGEYLAAHLPQARLAMIAGAAHAPFVSEPDVMRKLMMEFCNE